MAIAQSSKVSEILDRSPVLEHRLIPFCLFYYTIYSGRVAKEVMESSAKIKREPPEIHR